MIGVWQFFLTRGSKCTNQRKTILIACFLRGHLNIIQWGKIWISFDPKCFKAAGRSSLEKIWRPCYEERCQYNVEVCFHALNLQMHILFAVGSNWKMTLSDFGMGWSANSKKNKRNCQDIQWHQILIDEVTNRNIRSVRVKWIRVWREECVSSLRVERFV